MNKVLSKRIPREFKSNLPKYIALLLLIVLCMYLVTAMVASSETIIIRTDEHNAANHVEDGQFTTFLPLTDEQEKDITDKGVTLERMYSLDIKAEDGSTLRVMKNRRNIDLVELISGEYPSKDNEAVVERRYAEEHSLDVGSKLTVGGTEYTVCGIGASPDYDAPYQNMSDMAVSSKNFGIIFVTDSEYERVSDSSKSAQTFTYGYLLGNDMTDDKLKELIEDFDFDYTKVTDKYYLETVNEALEKRTEIENGINDLAEGADKLHNGLKDLSDGADTLYGGMNDLSDGADKLYDGLKTLYDGTVQLHTGMTSIYEGASALDKGLGELSGGASSLNSAIAGADSAGLIPPTMNALVSGADSLASGLKSAKSGSSELVSGISSANRGAEQLSTGATDAVNGAKELANGAKDAKDGAKELADGAKDAKDGACELADGIHELKSNIGKLLDAAFDLDLTNLTSFVKRADNVRIAGAAGDVVMNKYGGLAACVILMALFAYVISVFVVHQINRESSVIGALYALGVSKGALIRHYIMLPTIIAFIGGVLGSAIGFSPMSIQSQLADSYSYFSLPDFQTGAKDAKDGACELADGIHELKSNIGKLLDAAFDLDLTNLTSFVKRADNVRIAGAAGDVVMNKYGGLAACVILMALFAYVISVFVVHQINRESSVIGALYALGVSKGALIRHYIMLPTIIAFIGGVLGSAIGFSPMSIQSQLADSYSYFSLPDFQTVIPLYLVIYAVVIPPVIAATVNALVINRRLSAPALSLMRNEQNVRNISRMEIKSGGFVRKFRIRQLLREMRANITVAACMFVSMLILMLGLDCYSMCNNVTTDMLAGATYEYMYTLKYPTSEVLEGSEACYVKSLEKEKDGYTLDITVIGIDSDNPYYNVDVKKGKSIVTASLSVAQRYGVAEGDKLILTDEAAGTDYAFTVGSISDYSAGLAVFMDIDSMRELFRQDDDYYNMVLSDKALDIDEGRIYSVTTKSDIERSSKVFTELMSGMVITLVGTSAVIFVVVMYLMMGVMIDRSSFGISLLKTFGYSKKDVKKLYLDGNAITIAISAIICLPLSKLVMDRIYPSFIPNVACGINLNFAWYLYPALFIAVMLIYLLTSTLLVRKLNKITPAEVLKNRE